MNRNKTLRWLAAILLSYALVIGAVVLTSKLTNHAINL